MYIKVSVIIPVYNMEEYIRECLESVVNQTLKEIEVICVDDGSTDNTRNIIGEFVNRYNNFVLLCQEHQYAGVARDYGMSVAKGEYVAFLDSDDYFAENDSLEYLYKKAKENDADICYGELKNFLPDGSTTKRYKDREIESDGYVVFNFPTPVSSLPQGWINAIYNRSFLQKNNVTFGNYKIDQDVHFLFNAYIAAKKYYETKKYYYHRRVLEKAYDKVEDHEASFNCYFDLLNRHYEKRSVYPVLCKHFLIKIGLHLDYAVLTGKSELNEKLEKLNQMFECDPAMIKEVEEEYGVQLRVRLTEEERNSRIMEITHSYKIVHKLINENTLIYVYGAGYSGRKLVSHFMRKGEVKIEGFLVSGEGGYRDSLTGLPVISIDEFENKENNLILISVMYPKTSDEIQDTLDENKISNRYAIPYNELITYPLLENMNSLL